MSDDRDELPPLRRPPAPRAAAPRGSLAPVLTVAFSVVLLAVIVTMCAGTAGIMLLLAGAGVVGFVLLHYVVWGWWLAQHIRKSQANEGEPIDGGDEGA